VHHAILGLALVNLVAEIGQANARVPLNGQQTLEMKMKSFFTVLIITLSSLALQAQTSFTVETLRPSRPVVCLNLAANPDTAARPTAVKSKGKAMLLSLLFPGLGERYAGRSGRAQAFLAAEISLWLSYAGFMTYQDWRRNDYRSYAAANAGISLAGKSDSYFVDVGNYNSIEEYNAAKLRQRNLPAYYQDVEKYYWKWSSTSQKEKFEQLRLSAERAGNHGLFVLGAVVANHLISAIDAVWCVSRQHPKPHSDTGLDVHLGCTPSQVLFSVRAALR